MCQKIKLYTQLKKITNDIVDNIIGPACHIEGIIYDPWYSDISTWTMDDEDTNELILMQIADKYNLTEDQMRYIDSYTTLIQIALFIYLGQEST